MKNKNTNTHQNFTISIIAIKYQNLLMTYKYLYMVPHLPSYFGC